MRKLGANNFQDKETKKIVLEISNDIKIPQENKEEKLKIVSLRLAVENVKGRKYGFLPFVNEIRVKIIRASSCSGCLGSLDTMGEPICTNRDNQWTKENIQYTVPRRIYER